MLQSGFFEVEDRLESLSREGDPLVALKAHVDFERFRPRLKKLLKFKRGGRPPLDSVLMLKVLILQTLYNLSDDQIEYQIRDRLSFQRFLGLTLSDRVPDAKTVWLYRERLKGQIESLFKDFEDPLRSQGYLAMSGQIVDASVVKTPRQRLSAEEKAAVKSGKSAQEIWPDAPAKAAQKDTHARWRVKTSRPKKADQTPLAVPEFGYKNHICTDHRFGFVRQFNVSDAAHYDGHLLASLLDPDNTSSAIWGDTAYGSQENRDLLEHKGLTCQIHRKASKGKKLPLTTLRANGKRSKVRAKVEHVFALQKHRMGLFIRTIGLERARVKIGLANLVYNMKRLVFHETQAALTG